MNLIDIARRLGHEVEGLAFDAPVTHVYNPLAYAWTPHRRYLERYAMGRREVVLVGMNPGPWGMVQTGVPFGDVSMVRDWLGIEESVGHPDREHPRVVVRGFACSRQEVSGRRLWGWARAGWETAERFFARFVVLNYCPLCFLESSGRNRTPDRLRASERRQLFAACDPALTAALRCLRPRFVVGIGRFAEARVALAAQGLNAVVGGVPHPSPANPRTGRDWARQMNAALTEIGIELP